ncbi:hypothetical protein IV203_019578 [Nitzschia inconspicua]|uniref:Uncharacterized protein n=1 Tax=Nitzschia inconspicua TaxID=303405 RepID=A0A9K3Q4N1_9STRA|nr:hypothetical protein IV203_019578 [Nitzschia inconspicua]
MNGTAVMNMTDITEDFNKVSLDEADGASPNVTIQTEASENTGIPASPTRRLSRNKSGPQGNRPMPSTTSSSSSGVGAGGLTRRAPPGRSKSHKIGRPTFDPSAPTNEPVRGLNRSKSGRAKVLPGRTGSFNRRVPDRSASASSSLRTRRQLQQSQQSYGAESVDDVSVTDSVFTSASIQTLDSIAVRKKQIVTGDVPVMAGGMRGQRPVGGEIPAEFDDTLHTVDSMHLNHRHVSEEYYDDDCDDLSVFSESFASTESCEVLSDFEENEMDGAIAEDENEATVKFEGDEKME